MRLRFAFPLVTAVSVLAVLAAGPAVASSPDSTTGCQPAVAPAASGFLYQAASSPIDGPSAQSVCNAECQDGSFITCWGASCTATDASCPSQRGSCWGTDTGTRYCPVCTCSATASCPDGSSVSCTGTGNNCFAINGCYVSCNGHLTWCANPKGPCPIEAD